MDDVSGIQNEKQRRYWFLHTLATRETSRRLREFIGQPDNDETRKRMEAAVREVLVTLGIA